MVTSTCFPRLDTHQCRRVVRQVGDTEFIDEVDLTVGRNRRRSYGNSHFDEVATLGEYRHGHRHQDDQGAESSTMAFHSILLDGSAGQRSPSTA